MRNLTSLVLGAFLAACGPPATMPDVPSLPPTPAHELTLPAIYASSYEADLYARFDGTVAAAESTLSYGLSADYPQAGTVATPRGYALAKQCEVLLGGVVWRSLGEVQGTAAKLDLRDGALAVTLREEGTVSALLEGELTRQRCTLADGTIKTAVPLRHRVILQVRRVAGFVVEQKHQRLHGCGDVVVLPAGAPLWAPAVHPLDADGRLFEAVNAPAPATLTLRADGDLWLDGSLTRLRASPGTVAVTVATALPVQGLRAFTVVGPEALTAVTAAFYLRKAVSKGAISERIEEGRTYQLFFPEQSNWVDIQVDAATTPLGKLCANLPGTWLAATSATPAQCMAGVYSGEEPAIATAVAAIASLGECRLDVSLPGTSLRWTTRFSTEH